MNRYLRPALLGTIGCFTFLTTSALFGGQAPAPHFTQPVTHVVQIPSWDDVAADFPRCVSVQEGTDSLDTIAVVADAETGDVSTMPLGDVWARATDKKARNDVWTLGLCLRR
jgi:hypothetical protein